MVRKALAGVVVLAVAGCSALGARTAPEPAFDVIEQLDAQTEIRRYASVAVVEAPMGAGQDPAFRRLFGYISGDNDGGASFAMTAPVATDRAGRALEMTAPVAVEPEGMRFFLPRGVAAADAPRPSDPALRLRDLPQRTMAVRRFSGLRTDGAIATETEALEQAILASGWRADGLAEAWFYDPPWTLPPFRRNEIAVPVVAG